MLAVDCVWMGSIAIVIEVFPSLRQKKEKAKIVPEYSITDPTPRNMEEEEMSFRGMAALEVKDLCKTYNNRFEAVKSISFKLFHS